MPSSFLSALGALQADTHSSKDSAPSASPVHHASAVTLALGSLPSKDARAARTTPPPRPRVPSEYIGFWPAAFVRAPLPLGPLDAPVRVVTNGHLVSTLASNSIRHANGVVGPAGLPYGSLARLIVLFLVTHAVRTGNPRVPLGASVSGFLEALGISPSGGANGRLRYVYDQLSRLAACTLSERWSQHDSRAGALEVGSNSALVQHFALWRRGRSVPGKPALGAGKAASRAACTAQDAASGEKREASADDDAARQECGEKVEGVFDLAPGFCNEARGAAIPVDLRAVEKLRRSPLALDVYVWCTYTAARLERSGEKVRVVAWESLHEQFGRPYARRRDFSRAFVKALRRVQRVWPELAFYTTRGRLVFACNAPHVPRSACANG